MTLAMQPRGFTLIELLVVLAILGLLAGLVGPQVMKHLGKAKTDTAKLQIAEFGAALDHYYLENQRYPTQAEGLAALVVAPADLPTWNGPYLKKAAVPKDPWGKDFHYTVPSTHGAYEIVSFGADGAPGGEQENRDVASWE